MFFIDYVKEIALSVFVIVILYIAATFLQTFSENTLLAIVVVLLFLLVCASTVISLRLNSIQDHVAQQLYEAQEKLSTIMRNTEK